MLGWIMTCIIANAAGHLVAQNHDFKESKRWRLEVALIYTGSVRLIINIRETLGIPCVHSRLQSIARANAYAVTLRGQTFQAHHRLECTEQLISNYVHFWLRKSWSLQGTRRIQS